jgi:pilus assembly protein CpaF
MYTAIVEEKDGAPRKLSLDKEEVTIGRVQGNDIVLPKGNVSKRHARIVYKDERFVLVDLKSTNGTYVNGRKISAPVVVKPGDTIYIGDFSIVLQMGEQASHHAAEGVASSAAPPVSDYSGGHATGTGAARVTVDEDASRLFGDSATMGPGSFPAAGQSGSVRLPEPPSIEVGGSGPHALAASTSSPKISMPPALPPRGRRGSTTAATSAPVSDAPSRPHWTPAAPELRQSEPPPLRPSTSGVPSPRVSSVSVSVPDAGESRVALNAGESRVMSSAVSRSAAPASTSSLSSRPSERAAHTGVSAVAPSVFPATHSSSAPYSAPHQGMQNGQAHQATQAGPHAATPMSIGPQPGSAPATDVATALKYIMARLRLSWDCDNADAFAIENEQYWSQAQQAIERTLRDLQDTGLLDRSLPADDLAQAALRETVTFGALDPLLADDQVREILVQGHDLVWFDAGKGMQVADQGFSSPRSLNAVARRLLAQGGESLSVGQLAHGAFLPDGTYVHVTQPPFAARGLSIHIRRPRAPWTAAELVANRALPQDTADLLEVAVHANKNVLVVGATADEVSAALGFLVGLISPHERVLVVEQQPSLPVDRNRVLSLCVGPFGAEHGMRAALEQAAITRADHLVVDAMTAGPIDLVLQSIVLRREGSLLGFLGPSIEDALYRLGALGHRIWDKHAAKIVAQTFDLALHVRMHEGQLRMESVCEIAWDDDEMELKELFDAKTAFKTTGS